MTTLNIILDSTIVLKYSVATPGLLDAQYKHSLIQTETSALTKLTHNKKSQLFLGLCSLIISVLKLPSLFRSVPFRSVPSGCTLCVGSLFIHWLSLCSVQVLVCSISGSLGDIPRYPRYRYPTCCSRYYILLSFLIIYQPIDCLSLITLHIILDTTIVLQCSVVTPGLFDAKYNRSLIPTETSDPTKLTHNKNRSCS